MGGSRKIPDLKELAKSASEMENTETLLNKYGIKTEYAGTANINFNVLVQDKKIMEMARKEIKSRQGLEDYNLLLGIKSALGQQVGDINLINNQTQMQNHTQKQFQNTFKEPKLRPENNNKQQKYQPFIPNQNRFNFKDKSFIHKTNKKNVIQQPKK